MNLNLKSIFFGLLASILILLIMGALFDPKSPGMHFFIGWLSCMAYYHVSNLFDEKKTH